MSDYTRREAPTAAPGAYADALRWLLSLVDLERRPMNAAMQGQMTLERPAALLELAGRPQDNYRAVLVAGSKGKGSTAAMLAAILESAGYRTGFYSKPHLHTYRERVRVDGALISQEDFAAEVRRFQRLVASLAESRPDLGTPTTFEVTTALALDYFSNRGVDIAVVEVGLGGRLDATNVVAADLSVVTPISYEHTAVLGETLAAIAGEKAGIIKPGKPVLASPQASEALRVMRRVARERESALAVGGIDWRWHGSISDFTVSSASPLRPLWDEAWEHAHLRLSLLGSHQMENAATSVAAAVTLSRMMPAIGHGAVVQGLGTVRWPGRLEVLRPASASGPAIVVDGAHNRDSAERLATGLREHFHSNHIWLVIGVYADKDLRGIVAPLQPLVAGAWTVQTHQPRCRPAAEVAADLRAWNIEAKPAPSTAEAIEQALQAAAPGDLICVTGSLSIVAEAREALGLVPEAERDPRI